MAERAAAPSTLSAELAKLEADLEGFEHIAKQARQAGNVVLMKQAMVARIEMAQRIQDALPTPPPDPELDPSNVSARDRVRERLARMAKTHRCASCGATTEESSA